MVDYWIFGFGLVVTLVVGFGLTTMIISNNRLLERGVEEDSSVEAVPVEPTTHVGNSA